ncbi:MAG: type secretion system protein, partial [Proteobacteria bacterium]|nr:type secretion system protein [Pseudomonadota bacterium]
MTAKRRMARAIFLLMSEKKNSEHRLALAEVLAMLLEDGMVSPADAEALRNEKRLQGVGGKHPLSLIAEQKWRIPAPGSKLLHLEALTEWLAGRVGLDYLHIDPLKIDFTGVADVMSSTYAGRFSILPVQINLREVVIATAEPFMREWEAEIKHLSRKEIRRVVANPEDIKRYLVEFFNLAKSVKNAA